MKLLLKIIGFAMFCFLVIALILYFNGVTHVDFDDRYYRFLLDVNQKLSDWKDFTIPQIPSLDSYEGGDVGGNILNVLIGIANGFIWFFNLIISILDYVIDIIKFIVALLVVLFEDLPKFFVQSSSSSSETVSLLPII